MADTLADAVELLYTVNPEQLTAEQQIALAQAYAALAQAERLDQISQQLHTVHQLIQSMLARWAEARP
ncbi:hypothetical protein SAMN05444365_11131 [Micromonospora pattaloongensis]|uniref:Uncharacterized protein n=1 Tax=Micromonospora pattaloongensis TaxID=405436 RepID=A0A1H3SC44_9ACTN|nr:hypothetical protein [Micromonospora pattaloongensis]SDZ35494.1 hypothetical protein SAMN05444365_11131 [Micromonospora pattaloongensis]